MSSNKFFCLRLIRTRNLSFGDFRELSGNFPGKPMPLGFCRFFLHWIQGPSEMFQVSLMNGGHIILTIIKGFLVD